MGLIIGVTGTATADHFFNPSRVSRQGDLFVISAEGREFPIAPTEPVNGHMKIRARFDPALLRYADHKQFGGGGYNSATQMKSIAPDVEIRYSDSGTANPELNEDLLQRGIGYRYRGLYPLQENVVTGDPVARDKRIFKPELPSQAAVFPPEDQFDWTIEGGAVLWNSDKDRAWSRKLAAAAARGRVRLHAVLTPALPGWLLLHAIVPRAELIVAGLAELGEALGFDAGGSLQAGVGFVRMLARRAFSPVVHITLGKQGTLVSDPEEMAVLHVRLSPEKYRDVAAYLRDHSRVCGCGDCYAGAASLYTLTGRSVFGDGALHSSRFASAAIAGCAAGVRRLGYEGSLDPGDFVVSVSGDLGDGAAEWERRPA
jgi:hypothetical protein